MDRAPPKLGNHGFPGMTQAALPPVRRSENNLLDETGQRKKKMLPVNCEEVGMQFEHKSLVATELPPKLKEGRLGRKIKVISNCFPLVIPDGYVYHYDVKIKNGGSTKSIESDSETDSSSTDNTDDEVAEAEPTKQIKSKKYNCMSTKRNRQVINTMLRANDLFKGSYPVYDGKNNLYTRHRLKIDKKFKCEVSGLNGLKMEYFKVILKPSKKKGTNDCAISLEPLHALFEGHLRSVPEEAIMALETVLRNSPCMMHVPVGRSFFYPPSPNDLHPLGGGKEVWFGYHQSMRLGQWKPMVNLDISATVFYEKRPLLKYVAEIVGTDVDGLNHIGGVEVRDIERMSRELKSLAIEVNHLRGYRRRYRVQRLTYESANKLQFTIKEKGKEINTTVNAYFAQRYMRLHFPQLPCVQVKSNSEEKEGACFPIEVCEIIVQHCNKELTPKQSAEMIKFTVKPPGDRFEEIGDIFTKANYKEDIYLKEFGMDVLPEPMEVVARVLNAPSVRYDRENKVTPKNGAWNMREKQFIVKARVKSWVLLSFVPESQCTLNMLRHFARCLFSMANKQGIEMEQHKHIQQVDAKLHNVGKVLDVFRKKGADLIVIVMPTDKGKKKKGETSSKVLYNAIKQIAETTAGLATQCITVENVVKLSRKDNPSLVSNLCLKINAKMGGINHLLTPGETPVILGDKPVIVMGADVNHPGPSADKDKKPSLAAVVGTLNSDASCYAVSIRSQFNPKQTKQVEEIIHDLKDMVIYLLKQFYKHTKGLKPEKIVFYRDGVSEGQFKKVRDNEVSSIRAACRTLQEGYEPGITFIVVQKRHHVRFMPKDERDGENIPPGTVIDTTVTHPLNSDFFLCSHYGLKGTSRPGYYTMLADDNNFTADVLQKLTYSLCHTFARCTRSISLPAPVQYAHLAAYRARCHLASKENTQNASQTVTLDISEAISVSDNLINKMYFL